MMKPSEIMKTKEGRIILLVSNAIICAESNRGANKLNNQWYRPFSTPSYRTMLLKIFSTYRWEEKQALI